MFLLGFVVALGSCSSDSGDKPAETPTTSIVQPEVTTTTIVPATKAESFVSSGNRVLVIDPDSPTHVVLALHGHPDQPESLEPLGQHLSQQGAAVIIPKINTSPTDMGTQAIETACALSYAARSYPGLPVVIVGYSMGGLLAGQYVASPGFLANPSQCAGPYVGVEPVGVLLLDGPVWLEGYYEATGFGDPSDPLLATYDPVAIADPNPDLQVHYFYSNELPDFTPVVAERFDDAMGVNGAVTYLDTGHRGLVARYFDQYASAVEDIMANR